MTIECICNYKIDGNKMKNYKLSCPQSKTYSMVLHYICPSLLVDMIVGAGLVLVQGVWYKVGLFCLLLL